MKCPRCKEPSRVLETREHGDTLRRRRACDCGHRWTTFEGDRTAATVETLRRLAREVAKMTERQRHLEAEILACGDAVLAAFNGKTRQ